MSDDSGRPASLDVDREIQAAVDYINEVTNGTIGAGDMPVTFICASHRVIKAQRDELLKALKRLEPELTDQQRAIARDAINFAEFMNATGD